MSNIYFTLPNFYNNHQINIILRDLSQNNPEYFNLDNINFKAEESSFPFYSWNGGINLNKKADFVGYNLVANALSHTNGLKTIFDCSNALLTETDVYDSLQNMLLKYNADKNQGIIISNPTILDYIQKLNYHYNFIASPYFEIYDPELKRIKDFYLIRQFSTNINSKISKNKIELSVTNNCPECLNNNSCTLEHWNSILNFKETSLRQRCPNASITFLTPKEIQNFIKQGICHFYFDIINFPFNNEYYKNLIDMYLFVLIKIEFQEKVKNLLMEGMNG